MIALPTCLWHFLKLKIMPYDFSLKSYVPLKGLQEIECRLKGQIEEKNFAMLNLTFFSNAKASRIKPTHHTRLSKTAILNKTTGQYVRPHEACYTFIIFP